MIQFRSVLKKSGDFVTKNWKVIGLILLFLIVSGMAKRFFGRISMWWSVRNALKNPESVDYDMLAISVHSAMYQGLFNMGENEGAIIAFINSLGSQDMFLKLAMRYALKYGKDLRAELRDHFSDKQYSKLLWK